MASNLNYKQVANVTRRKWDVETYEKKAKARQDAAEKLDRNDSRGETVGESSLPEDEKEKEEFLPAESGAAGPVGSKRSFLKARKAKVDIESKVGTIEMVSVEEVATTSSSKTDDGSVVKTGIGWHCKVCDCYLKDSLTYLDHINGRKHQRKLGYTMRVERSTKDQLMDRLKSLADKKNEEESKKDPLIEEVDYDEIVKAKDVENQRIREEKRKKRQERKKQKEVEPPREDEEEEEVQPDEIDPAMAAMMGFTHFGGSV